MKAEEIKAALQGASQETLADALAIVLAEGKAASHEAASSGTFEPTNFAQAIIHLKKNFSFEELEYFSTEADLVYVETGGRRILLTNKMSTAQAVQPSGSVAAESVEATPQIGGSRFSNLEI